jgi:hypothetical protein
MTSRSCAKCLARAELSSHRKMAFVPRGGRMPRARAPSRITIFVSFTGRQKSILLRRVGAAKPSIPSGACPGSRWLQRSPKTRQSARKRRAYRRIEARRGVPFARTKTSRITAARFELRILVNRYWAQIGDARMQEAIPASPSASRVAQGACNAGGSLRKKSAKLSPWTLTCACMRRRAFSSSPAMIASTTSACSAFEAWRRFGLLSCSRR